MCMVLLVSYTYFFLLCHECVDVTINNVIISSVVITRGRKMDGSSLSWSGACTPTHSRVTGHLPPVINYQ